MDLRNFGFILKDVTRLYSRRFEERAIGLSLTIGQCKALATLARNEGISQKRLSEIAEIEPMTLVRILDRMESDAWIERRPDPVDRRARTLFVTPKSAPILDQITQLSAQMRAEALAGIAGDERATLMNLLERVHLNLLSPKPAAATPDAPAELAVAGKLATVGSRKKVSGK